MNTWAELLGITWLNANEGYGIFWPYSVYGCFDKGCTTTARMHTRQCRLVLWLEGKRMH